MSRKKYVIILILAITALLCMVGASTWIITSPSTLTPSWDKGKTPIWVKRYAEFDYGANPSGVNLSDELAAQIVFCDENGESLDTDTVAESVIISGISVSNGDSSLEIKDNTITVGSTYRVDNISIRLKNGYQLVGTYTTTSEKENSNTYVSGNQNSYQLNGLLLKYKTVYQGNPAQTPQESRTYYTIEDALSTLSGTISIEKGSTSFTALADTFTGYNNNGRLIGAGKTLLIPRSSDDAGATNVINAGNKTAYATLILPSAINLTVNGTLTVNASRHSGSSEGTSNILTHGLLEVKKNAHIEITSGATWYCLGYSYGEGTINVASGATVYETFSMPGWKGGKISASIRNKVFPLNQYAVNGIICRTTFNTGCTYKVQAFLTASTITGSSVNLSPVVDFITSGNSSFLQLTSGSIDKWIEEDTGKIHFAVNGTMTFHNISIEIMQGVTASTTNRQVPLPGNFAITLNSGAATIPSDVQLKLLPGATLNINKDASLIVNGGAYAYGNGNVSISTVTMWQDGNNNVKYPTSNMSGFYRVAPNLGYDASAFATVTIAGKLTVNSNGKVGGYFDGVSDGQITLNGSISGNSFQEDYSTYGEFGTLDFSLGLSGTFFNSTFSTKGPIWNGDQKSVEDFQTGVWIFTDGAWKQAGASNSITVHVTFNAGDGTFADGQHTRTDDLTMFVENVSEGGTIDYSLTPSEDPTLSFYAVEYWYYSDGGSEYKLEEIPLSVHNDETITLYAHWEPIQYDVTLIVQPAGMSADDIAATLNTDKPLIDIIEDGWNIEGSSSLDSYINQMATLLANYDTTNTFVLVKDVYLAAELTNLDGLSIITELTADTLRGADLLSQYGIILVCKAAQTLPEFTLEFDFSDVNSKDPDIDTSVLKGGLIQGFMGEYGKLIEGVDFEVHDYDPTKQYYFDGWYIKKDSEQLIPVATTQTITMGDLTGYEENGHIKYKLTLTPQMAKKVPLTVTSLSNASVTANGHTCEPNKPLYFKPGTVITVKATYTADSEQTLKIDPDDDVSDNDDNSKTFTINEERTIEASSKKFCIVEGTLITMADGTQKPVEEVKAGDDILVFNHETGKYEAGKMWFVDDATQPKEWHTIIRLTFSDSSSIGISYRHGFFDLDINKYVYIDAENYEDYIGHRFTNVKQVNGEFVSGEVTLVSGSVANEYVRVFGPISEYHFNMVTDGLLTMPSFNYGETGFFNFFEFGEGMKYDEEKMQADIEQYGLFTYEEFADLITYDIWCKAPMQYLKISIAKGLMTFEDIELTVQWLIDKGFFE